MHRKFFNVVAGFTLTIAGVAAAATVTTQNPIMFVTQVPNPADFTAIGSTFGNQLADVQSVPRGGDLYIRYPDGTLKNLTAAAGFGLNGQQGPGAIAVRDPAIHWNGTKAIFSMVIGGASKQFEVNTYYWQLYEITGFGQGQTPVITKVPNQPANYNNISPSYGSDDRILFTTDRPRDGSTQLYPQLDEYEEAPTVTGIWSLDPTTGDLFILSHNPSGNFTPFVDSFGRVIFTRWDHLQRDQQADADAQQGNTYGTFNYADETANAAIGPDVEVYPEPRSSRTDLLAGTNLTGVSFNQFFPWQINEDGTEEETLNHIGRHELYGYFEKSLTDDPALVDYNPPSGRFNPVNCQSFLHIKEDPKNPGLYYATDAPEFFTHAGGRIVTITGSPLLYGDQMAVTSITDPSTASFVDEGVSPTPQNSGHYRNPVPLSDGQLIAVHTFETHVDKNLGTTANPISRYDYRLNLLVTSNGNYMTAGALLNPGGINKTVTWWDPDTLVTYSGPLWEMGPVEVVARTRPARLSSALEDPEKNVLAEEGVDETALRSYLKQNNLALLVSRNVTTRDSADHQQPYNLRVAGTSTQTLGNSGKIYDIAEQQFFQADQIRGLGVFKAGDTPKAGRRVLAQTMHDPNVKNPPNSDGPAGSVKIGADGSTAAFVPARRAMTWQITDAAGTPVIRERYWLTFQPGEIRSCTSCHGINTKDQAGNPKPLNEPQALHDLLKYYKTLAGGGGTGTGTGPGSGTGNGTGPGAGVAATDAPDADKDGFPDALEIALGSSPTDATSTPFGVVLNSAPLNLTLSKCQIKLNFASSGHDQIMVAGVLPVPAGFKVAGQQLAMMVGGVATPFTLDSHGSAKGTKSFKLGVIARKGAVATQNAKFASVFNQGSFSAAMAGFNLTSTNATNQTATMPVYIVFNQNVYKVDAPLLYTAKKGKTGMAKLH